MRSVLLMMMAVFGLAARAWAGGTDESNSAASPPPGPGLDLIQQRCTSCHPATQIFTAPPKTAIEWRRTVKKMAANGAELAPEEIETITEYLAQHFAAKGEEE